MESFKELIKIGFTAEKLELLFDEKLMDGKHITKVIKYFLNMNFICFVL